MKLDKKAFNWYGFKHAEVRKRFGDLDGKLTYVGTFCVNGAYNPAAVYHAPNPDKSKGHKEYVLLYKGSDSYFVTGMTAKEIAKYRYQDALKCPKCKDLIYSIMRHDFRHCKCQTCFIDGGRDYTRQGSEGLAVTIDHLTGKTL